MQIARQLSSTCRLLAKKASAPKKKYLGRISNNLSLGVVGLANVGKSTFFQAITRSTLGNPANYPFATIEAEKSLVVVESAKLDQFQKLFQSEKKVPTSLTVYDIAGLTRNAASGQGLGNKFLADIRLVDGIFHVVRGFRDEEITHIENSVDPVRDMTIVTDELILKDLDFIETALENANKKVKKPGHDKALAKFEIDTLEKILDLLYSGRKVASEEWTEEEIDIINPLNLLTAKPTVVLLNVNPKDYITNNNEFMEQVEGWIQENLIEGSTAPEAAGAIHTDLQNTFISAQVYKWEDVKNESGPLDEAALKSKGKQLRVGKTYVVEDGDVLVVKAARGKK
ncbi:hypothetical protein HF325_003600 [Metschnikowia pulcherrima]|uniref:OBG-type G domain-containing protein n=1 Tax=Metschnikowia pulcherrima TaxID=27326 RepID=A0A8H7GT45_9ASCO|nr:hypothetical protein HF325_003600 [Metschnikowia pulcherrima]